MKKIVVVILFSFLLSTVNVFATGIEKVRTVITSNGIVQTTLQPNTDINVETVYRNVGTAVNTINAAIFLIDSTGKKIKSTSTNLDIPPNQTRSLYASFTLEADAIGYTVASEPNYIPRYVKNIYVSKNGNDLNNGSERSPYLTIERAKLQVRSYLYSHEKNIDAINIVIKEGTYEAQDTFMINSEDTSSEIPITYKNYNNDKVILSNNLELNKTDFINITNADSLYSKLPAIAQLNVKVIDLSSRISATLPMVDVQSQSKGNPYTHEFFTGDKRLMLARYPNTDYLQTGIVDAYPTGQDPNTTGIPMPFKFKFTDTAKLNLWKTSKDAWIYGYFGFLWYDQSFPLEVDSPNQKLGVSLTAPYTTLVDMPYYVFNMIEELDVPGEWYFDRQTKKLYVYPNSDFNTMPLSFSKTTNSVVQFNNAKNITMTGLEIRGTAGTAVAINSGENVTIDKCTIKNAGQQAVTVNKGLNHKIQNCSISEVGKGGIFVDAGDRKTLTAGNTLVYNNEIFSFNRVSQMGCPGVSIKGVSNIVKNNEIWDGTQTAILFAGNENTIEGNDIHNVLKNTSDAGAIYAGRDVGARGNKIISNYIHDIISDRFVFGIYLDDYFAGVTIKGNVFKNLKTTSAYQDTIAVHSIFVHGGMDNKIENNAFIDSGTPYVDRCYYMHFWENQKDANGNPTNIAGVLESQLLEVSYKSAIWTTKYPYLGSIMQLDDKHFPKGTTVEKNVFYNLPAGNGSLIIAPVHPWYAKPENVPDPLQRMGAEKYVIPTNNYTATDKNIFANYDGSDYTINNVEAITGFEKIDFTNIGRQPIN
jgi:hypothetical protein